MFTHLKNHGVQVKETDEHFCVNPSQELLKERIVSHGFGVETSDGALSVETGKFTGRCAQDKYVVVDEMSEKTIWWENNVHRMTPALFDEIKKEITDYLNTKESLYLTTRSVGAIKEHALNVNLLTPSPVAALFSQHLFRADTTEDLDHTYTIFHAPELEIKMRPELRASTVIALDFSRKTILIAGTKYCGEMKKAMFTVMNYVLTDKGILPTHSGSNKNPEGETSIFFGLSGTGKTTLSTDEGMTLIGDDEHGLSQDGVFNFENGCYAKTIKLKEENEPEIYRAARSPFTLLENVILKDNKDPDFDDDRLTQNGRAAYPLTSIDEVDLSGKGEIPKNIFFLTCDAFGVVPAVSKLTPEQAMYYFILGYTAKVAGTELGVSTPQATFSACFGAPFMPRHPQVYADLLQKYLKEHDIKVWLINTGWYGGTCDDTERFPIKVTRQIIRAIQAHKVGDDTHTEGFFGLQIPNEIEGVDKGLLNPQAAWQDPKAYEAKATELVGMFKEHMKSFDLSDDILKGGPQ